MKTLKQLVRNVIDPDRDLGHIDRNHQEKEPDTAVAKGISLEGNGNQEDQIREHSRGVEACEDCE